MTTQTSADLTTATPVEIDTALAAIYQRLWAAEHRFFTAADHIVGYRKSIDKAPTSYDALHSYPKWIEEEEANAAQARADIAAARAEAEPFEAEFDRRGGWTRAFLVLTSGRGHVHRSMNCTTCYPTTQFSWITAYSGADEAAIVTAAGEDACTVCYSTAPATPRHRAMWAPEEHEREAARLEREDAKAKRAAAKAAKAITTPDGEPLRVFNYRSEERTVRDRNGASRVVPARDHFDTLETAHAAKSWLTDSQETWSRGKRPEDVRAVTEALAAKFGTTPEAEIEAAKKRAAKRR
jgi:hypothetical protein